MNNIILDASVGAIVLGLFSYFTEKYKNNHDYIKILAFLWASPSIFFYILAISSRNGIKSMNALTIHALLGIIITTIAILFTLYFIKLNSTLLISINFIYLFTVMVLYFYYKIYTLF